MTTPIATNVNLPTFERLIELVEVDLSSVGDTTYHYLNSSKFDAELPEQAILSWGGKVWLPVPFECAGFQRGGQSLVRPSIRIPDFGGALYVKLRELDGAYGVPITRYTAFAADIEAGSQYAFAVTEKYVINTVSRAGLTLTLELATHLDFAKRKVPGVKMERTMYPGLSSNLQRN